MEASLEALGLDLHATRAVLAYRDDLLRFNRAYNLVSRRRSAEVAESLILESVSAALRLPIDSGHRVLDLGSGAGFPGILVGILRPSLPLVLLDRRAGRCEFLRREVRALRLTGVRVWEGEASAFARALEHPLDWVLAKAVAPAEKVGQLAGPMLAPRGHLAIFQRRGWAGSPGELWIRAGAIELGDEEIDEAPAVHLFRLDPTGRP